MGVDHFSNLSQCGKVVEHNSHLEFFLELHQNNLSKGSLYNKLKVQGVIANTILEMCSWLSFKYYSRRIILNLQYKYDIFIDGLSSRNEQSPRIIMNVYLILHISFCRTVHIRIYCLILYIQVYLKVVESTRNILNGCIVWPHIPCHSHPLMPNEFSCCGCGTRVFVNFILIN